MRRSSVIVFASFALLASTFPINGINQDNNSLWKRVGPVTSASGGSGGGSSRQQQAPNQQPPPPASPHNPALVPVYRDTYGTRILASPLLSWGSFRHSTEQITFRFDPHNPEDGTITPHVRYTFNRLTVLGMEMQDYRDGQQMMVSILKCPNGNSMIFHPHIESNDQYDTDGNYIGRPEHRYTILERHMDHGYSRHYLSNGELMLGYVKANGEWIGPLLAVAERAFQWNLPRSELAPQQ